jgi:hypothetical protein
MMTRFAIPGTSAAVTPSCVDDATLIDRLLRTDDEEAFEMLVRRYQEKVFRLAASILGPGADSEAEDTAQVATDSDLTVVESAIDEELKRFLDIGPSQQELERVKTQSPTLFAGLNALEALAEKLTFLL